MERRPLSRCPSFTLSESSTADSADRSWNYRQSSSSISCRDNVSISDVHGDSDSDAGRYSNVAPQVPDRLDATMSRISSRSSAATPHKQDRSDTGEFNRMSACDEGGLGLGYPLLAGGMFSCRSLHYWCID